MTNLSILIFFSIFSFIIFGIGCFFSSKMKTEFIRYQVPEKRKLVGSLQLLGAIGLLLGYYYLPALVIFSSGGLALLMVLGFSVRLKIKDNFIQSAPSFFYAFINLYIATRMFQELI